MNLLLMLRRLSVLRSRSLLSSLLGVVTALLVMEVGLRPFVAGWNYPTGPIREIRQFTEGIVTSHYVVDGLSPYGGRWTGNGLLPGAPTGLILSDSHGIADSVADRAIVSSVIERMSRSAGQPLNVVMYGWYAGAAPTYVAVADQMIQKWNPAWVAVLLNVDDLGRQPLYGVGSSWYWQMKIRPDLSIELVDVRPPIPKGKWEDLRQFVGRSTLALSLRRRTAVLASASEAIPGNSKQEPSEVAENLAKQLAEVPIASVRALKQKYGDRLLLVYMPSCKVTCTDKPDAVERELLRVCRDEKVRCSSVREALLAARDRDGRFYRGFHNTRPDEGHLNEVGHQIVAQEIWRVLSAGGEMTGHR